MAGIISNAVRCSLHQALRTNVLAGRRAFTQTAVVSSQKQQGEQNPKMEAASSLPQVGVMVTQTDLYIFICFGAFDYYFVFAIHVDNIINDFDF